MTVCTHNARVPVRLWETNYTRSPALSVRNPVDQFGGDGVPPRTTRFDEPESPFGA